MWEPPAQDCCSPTSAIHPWVLRRQHQGGHEQPLQVEAGSQHPLKAVLPAGPLRKREGQTKSVLWGFSPGDTCDMRFKLKYHTVSHVNITNRVFLSFLRPGRTFPAEARDRCS